jgi:methionine synthase II (cobalamin-independent)
VAGPWTLAASIELPSGHRVVSDHGATRDLAESLAEGLRAHLADLARRVPGATIVTQLDEPSVPAVLAARIPTPSGWGTVRGVEASVVEQALGDVLSVAEPGARVVHCCAGDAPLTLFRGAGADAIALDASVTADRDALGEAVEAGTALWLGVVPSTDAPITLDRAREPIQKLWRELGFADEQLAAAIVPTPACGLAGASPDYARRALEIVRDLGRSFIDLQS